MKKYFYFVATPESMIVSHLSPHDFGNYLAVGTRKQLRSQAIYIELDPDKLKLPWDYIEDKLIPYEDGEPKRSVYLSIYRVLEHIPTAALKSLYLATDDGKVLEIKRGTYISGNPTEIHLYQQLSPIATRVASKLSPPEFVQFLTDTSKPVSAPKVFFVELHLNELALNPNAPLNNLPYRNPDHLRECILKLQQSPERQTKTVMRFMRHDISYRTIKDGFFAGDSKDCIFYPFPSFDELENHHFSWWKSALNQHYL